MDYARVALHLSQCVLVCCAVVLSGCGGDAGADVEANARNGPSAVEGPPAQLGLNAQYIIPPLSTLWAKPWLQKTVVGDLNGDSRNDVATYSNMTVNGTDLVVFYQDTTGGLDRWVWINSDVDLNLKWIRDIAIGDLNGDGRSDLALLGSPRSRTGGCGEVLVVLYQNAKGELGPPVEYGSPEICVPIGISFAIGDLNGDGRNDVAFAIGSAFFQDEKGALGPLTMINPAQSRREIHIADMDGDGDNDLVIQYSHKQLGVVRQLSPGVFSDVVELYDVQLSYWTEFQTFAVGDLNGDGKSDVVVLDPGNSGYLNIFIQNAAGSLDPARLLTMRASPLYGIEISDIDGDGLNDILGEVIDAGIPHGIGQVHVFYQTAEHGFRDPVVYTFPTAAGGGSIETQALSVGDVNDDGRPDVILTWLDEGLFVLRNRAPADVRELEHPFPPSLSTGPRAPSGS